MYQHPWHNISPGSETPHIVNAVIEISSGSKAKYELDKDTGFLKLDRVLFSAVHYPANYGFIPRSYCGDQDPLDILVLCSVVLQPLCLVEAKVIGVMQMQDEKGQDDKIIAVAKNDMSVNHIQDISDLAPHTLLEIQRFFEDYKILENKRVLVENLGGHQKAYEIVNQSLLDYHEVYERDRG